VSDINSESMVWELDPGWSVVTADGSSLGVVEGVHPYEIIVRITDPSPTMLFVPVNAITDIETDTVYLSVAMADVPRQDWALIPDSGDLMLDECSCG
jgi:hypothetical protein